MQNLLLIGAHSLAHRSLDANLRLNFLLLLSGITLLHSTILRCLQDAECPENGQWGVEKCTLSRPRPWAAHGVSYEADYLYDRVGGANFEITGDSCLCSIHKCSTRAVCCRRTSVLAGGTSHNCWGSCTRNRGSSQRTIVICK